jgi:hypothetical protein
MHSQKRYEVHEVAADRQQLEEKLNEVAAFSRIEQVVWANGKLLVIARSTKLHKPGAKLRKSGR